MPARDVSLCRPCHESQVPLQLQGEREEYHPTGIPEPRHSSPFVQAAVESGMKSM